jgi:hypothetical protein
MLEKISIILACLAASTAFAMVLSVQSQPISHQATISPTIICWPDENAQTCWRRAEHRLGH